MTKIIQFVETSIPFVRDSYHQAIQDLHKIDQSIITLSYTYDQLRKNDIDYEDDNVVLFLEAGQLQPKHSGWNMDKFKKYFPNSKVVVWSSDLEYYKVNEHTYQFKNIVDVDLVFECTPSCSEIWSIGGIENVIIPWTISRWLYDQLRELAGTHINFNRKNIDFCCLANFSGEYRKNLQKYVSAKGYYIEVGERHDDQNLDRTYEKFLNAWLTLGSTSHNRPELNLPGQHTFKGYRDAVGITLNSLLIYDNYPQLTEIWNMGDCLPLYDFNDFNSILEICDYYKNDLVAYTRLLRKQQAWLENHLLDWGIYNCLRKYNIL